MNSMGDAVSQVKYETEFTIEREGVNGTEYTVIPIEKTPTVTAMKYVNHYLGEMRYIAPDVRTQEKCLKGLDGRAEQLRSSNDASDWAFCKMLAISSVATLIFSLLFAANVSTGGMPMIVTLIIGSLFMFGVTFAQRYCSDRNFKKGMDEVKETREKAIKSYNEQNRLNIETTHRFLGVDYTKMLKDQHREERDKQFVDTQLASLSTYYKSLIWNKKEVQA
jgi:hypothetical protein